MTGIFDRDGVNRGGGQDIFTTQNYTQGTGTGTQTITLTPGNDITINGGTTPVEGNTFIIASTAVSPDTTYELSWDSSSEELVLTGSDGDSERIPVRASGDLTLSTVGGGINISYTNPNPTPYVDRNPDVPNFEVSSSSTDPAMTEYALVNDGSGNVSWQIIIDDTNPGITQVQADARYVSFEIDQTATIDAAEAAVARTNIGAGTSSFSGNFPDLAQRPNVVSPDGTTTLTDSDTVANQAYVDAVNIALSAERNERMAADTTITTDYQAGDANLQSQLDAIMDEDAAITVQMDGDAALDPNTTAQSVRDVIGAAAATDLTAETAARQAAITAEANARSAEDTRLAGLITSGDDSVRSDLTSAYTAAVTAVENRVDLALDNRIQNSETRPTQRLIDGTLWVDHTQNMPELHVWNGRNFEPIVRGQGARYSAVATYNAGDIISSDTDTDRLFVSQTQGNEGNALTDTDHWLPAEELTQDQIDAINSSINLFNASGTDAQYGVATSWVAGATYNAGDAVFFQGALWRRNNGTESTTGILNIPSVANGWTEIAGSGGGGGGGSSFLTRVVGEDANAAHLDFSEGGLTQLQIGNQNNINSFVSSNQLNLSLDIAVWSNQLQYTANTVVRTETSVGGETGNLWFALVESGPASTVGAVSPTLNDGQTSDGTTQVWQRMSTSHLIENSAGSTLPPRANLQFVGAGDSTVTVTDDEVEDRTVVTVSSTSGGGTGGNAVSWAQTGNNDAIPDDTSNKLDNIEEWARTSFSTQQLPAAKVPLTLTTSLATWDGVTLNVPVTARNSISVGSEATPSGNGGLDYNPATGVFTYIPPELANVRAGLTNNALTTFNDISFNPGQFQSPAITTNLDTGRTELQFSLFDSILPERRTFSNALDTSFSTWFVGRDQPGTSRSVFSDSNIIQVRIDTTDSTAFPIGEATLASITVDGVELTPDQYNVIVSNVDTTEVFAVIQSDEFESIERALVVHYSLTDGNDSTSTADVTLRFTTYFPVYSGVTLADTDTVDPGADPRWQVAWSGTTNTFTPSMGVSEQISIGLQNDSDLGRVFNSGTTTPIRTTIQQNAIRVPQRLGAVGQTISFQTDWTLDTALLQEFKNSASIALLLEIANDSGRRTGDITRIPIPSPFTQARSTNEALLFLTSDVAFTYTDDNSAIFEVDFSLVPNRQDRVNISVTISGAGANNNLFAIGPNHTVAIIAGLTSGGVLNSQLEFDVDSDVTIQSPRFATDWSFSSGVTGVAAIVERQFTPGLGPTDALDEAATAILALDNRFTRIGTFTTATDPDGVQYSVVTIDLGVNEDVTTNFGTSSNSGANTAVFMAMRNGDPMAPPIGQATAIMATATIRTRPELDIRSVAIAGAVIGSATSATDIAQLFADATASSPLDDQYVFGGVFEADADNGTNVFRYLLPTRVATQDNDIVFMVDNGMGDGDLSVAPTANTVVGRPSQLTELMQSDTRYSDVTFYDLQRGTNHHLLVPDDALAGASPEFLVLDVDTDITFPWDASGNVGNVYFNTSPIDVFGTAYTDFRFTTAYGPGHPIPNGSHIHARGSRVQ